MRIHTVGFMATADVTPKTRTDHTNGMARVPCPSPGVRFPKARTVVLETVCITTVSLQNDGEQASRSAGRVARRILAVVPPYHHDHESADAKVSCERVLVAYHFASVTACVHAPVPASVPASSTAPAPASAPPCALFSALWVWGLRLFRWCSELRVYLYLRYVIYRLYVGCNILLGHT